MSRDPAATHRTGSAAQPAEENNKTVQQQQNSELVLPQADAPADRTTTYRTVSPVSEPSELGIEPDTSVL